MELMKGPQIPDFPFFLPSCNLRDSFAHQEMKYSKPFTGGVKFSSSLQILEVNYSFKFPMA